MLVFLAVLLLFGPRKLPGIARSIGHVLQQLRRASDDFKHQLMSVEDEVQAEARDVVDATVAQEGTRSGAAFPVDESARTDAVKDVSAEAVIDETDEATAGPSRLPGADSEEDRPRGG
ncbi:MAG: twin-arginine translocase TatA/TatE family subunit [Lentisphaerae bacterium]|nr:twin-arginine translocase TatA/TatE family subunit [Lentisphaerota bacterium]